MTKLAYTGSIGIAILWGIAATAVDIEWVVIGDPGNPDDTPTFGAVADTFFMGRYEVTNAEYAEFLNAVADVEDTFALWDSSMNSGQGGITRSTLGNGTFQYDAILGREDWPVNWVTFWDALRFANWLHNGQPAGMQDASTTEDGAYDMNAQDIANNDVARLAGADVFVPTEDEWYKAAYYDGAVYFDYPTGTDSQTTCDAPGATPNTANCDFPFAMGPTEVGSYTGSASPYGTFDQGGNVWEWVEDRFSPNRSIRGGAFNSGSHHDLMAGSGTQVLPTQAGGNVGFRVAPEPAGLLSFALGTSMLAWLSLRRRGDVRDA